MGDTTIVVDDGATPSEAPPSIVRAEMGQFRVLTGIFKGGRAYAKDEVATIEVHAGRGLAAAGDVEEVK